MEDAVPNANRYGGVNGVAVSVFQSENTAGRCSKQRDIIVRREPQGLRFAPWLDQSANLAASIGNESPPV